MFTAARTCSSHIYQPDFTHPRESAHTYYYTPISYTIHLYNIYAYFVHQFHKFHVVNKPFNQTHTWNHIQVSYFYTTSTLFCIYISQYYWHTHTRGRHTYKRQIRGWPHSRTIQSRTTIPAEKNKFADGHYLRTPSYDFRHYTLILVFHYRSPRTGGGKSPPAEPHAGGRRWYDGVLPSTPNGWLASLLSPPQCHAALGTIPHTLASVDQSPVRRPRTLPPSATRTPRVGFWRGRGRQTLAQLRRGHVRGRHADVSHADDTPG
jgi:hypothetical protein